MALDKPYRNAYRGSVTGSRYGYCMNRKCNIGQKDWFETR